MKLSVGLISIFLSSALALSVKRQNDAPDCVDGDTGSVPEQGPYSSGELTAVSYVDSSSNKT
jgi:hypothetical protein